MAEREHNWTVVSVYEVTEDEGRRLHALHGPDEREAALREMSDHPMTVRGPICSECRVHWRDVFAKPDEPIPCPGKRPEELGGPLVKPEAPRMSRQARRALLRKARKDEKKRERV